MNLRDWHKVSAGVLASFLVIHVVNHLVSLVGVSTHIAFMKMAREVYRQPVIESILMASVAFQIASGLRLVVRGWRRRHGAVAWLQALSGVVLAGFMLIHVGAVLFGRTVLGLDTNFYYAAAGFFAPPYQFFFGPYYFLAIFALACHLGCAVYWYLLPSTPKFASRSLLVAVALGAVLAMGIVLSLAGLVRPFEVPTSYLVTYGQSR